MVSTQKTPVRLNAPRFVVLACLVLGASGCSMTKGVRDHFAYNDTTNDFVMGWRNTVWARQAWHNQKHHFAGHAEFHALGAGFRDGYVDVATGGSGCPPSVPPRKYWSWKYQTAEGQCKVAAWFEGFAHGARAAEVDGADNFQDIQVSYLIETQYSPEFQAGQIPILGHGEFVVPGEGPQAPTGQPHPAGPMPPRQGDPAPAVRPGLAPPATTWTPPTQYAPREGNVAPSRDVRPVSWTPARSAEIDAGLRQAPRSTRMPVPTERSPTQTGARAANQGAAPIVQRPAAAPVPGKLEPALPQTLPLFP